jgi:hypothetical protein
MSIAGWVGALLLLAGPAFWNDKPPADWTMDEVLRLLTDSPWGQIVEAGPRSQGPRLAVYVATADPVMQAEDRLRAARKQPTADPSWEDYREYILAEHGKLIVVAVRLPNPDQFSDAAEGRQMEQESVLKIGKRRYKIAGHFPPSSSDPYVRLAFPRDVRPGDRSLVFELYIPGVSYRAAEFKISDMTYRGKPSF